MIRRRFGRTGLQIPALSCGGMRFQHSWEEDPADRIPDGNQENLERVVARALELGIDHFETARGYGTSESQLGRILPRIDRDKILVQTKVGPSDDPAEFRSRFETSLRSLGLGHVDLLAIHGLNNEELVDQALRPGGCLALARQFQREGRARFIGFSTHAPAPLTCRVIETGEFDFVNLHWYITQPLTTPALAAAARHDLGVFIISPSDKGGRLFDPPPLLSSLARPLSPMQLNDLYCLARPEIHTISVGAAAPGEFDPHVDALRHLGNAAELVPPIARRLTDRLAETLGVPWDEHWADGIPDFDGCPGEINVREIVRLWCCARALDMIAFAKMRYNAFGQFGHWHPGNEAADIDERALLDATRQSPLSHRLPSILREAHALFKEPFPCLRP